MALKKLPPPKGTAAATQAAAAAAETEQDRIARLSNRYQEHATEPARPGPLWPQPNAAGPATAPPAGAPASETPPSRPEQRRRPVSRSRPEPEGMTRKTFYLTVDAAAALEGAVTQIQRATGGTVNKHAALGALIAAGVAQIDTVTQALREQVLQSLTVETTPASEAPQTLV
jgi:hypothetical protein